MPVLKVCGNPNTYERMRHDMDLNAGRIITGEKSIQEVGEEAFSAALEILSGRQTRNETLGYHSSIDIYTLGPVIWGAAPPKKGSPEPWIPAAGIGKGWGSLRRMC